MRPRHLSKPSALVVLGWALMLCLLAVAAACSSGPPAQASAGDTAPDFNLPAINAETADLSQARGQTAIVVFWHTE